MSRLDQKRLLKLAGLLKEGMEEWPRSLTEEEEELVPKAKVGNLDVPMGYDIGEPEYKWEPPSDREAMESLYSDMYKELHNIRPRWVDFENLSDSKLRKMILDLQDDIDASFESEQFDREREEEYVARERDIEELEPSAEEEELERLPKHMGMGRGAGLEETYIDNMKEEVRALVREVLLEKKEEKKWMQKAGKEMEKKGTKGALHKQLGKKEGEKLSKSELEKIKRELQAKAEGDAKLTPSDRKLLRRVIFALNAMKAKD